MNRKLSLTLLVLLLVSALALYVVAQSQTDGEKDAAKAPLRMGHGTAVGNWSGAVPYVVGRGVKSQVTLCTGPTMATDGTAKCLYQALPASGKLRIEMQDGTIQVIDLNNVKKMTFE
jgi:hypothetical protein